MGYLKVKVDLSAITGLQTRLMSTAGSVEHTVAVQAAKDTEQFVPASGSPAGLYDRTQVKDNLIIYPGPYSRYLYFGKLMVDPNTGSAFAKKGVTKVLTGKNLKYNQTVHSEAQSHWFEASKAQNLDKWKNVAAKAVERELNS